MTGMKCILPLTHVNVSLFLSNISEKTFSVIILHPLKKKIKC